MRIEHHLVAELPTDLRLELSNRVDREFGHIPIVREHVWATPTWAFMGFVDDQLVTFLNIVDRQVMADGQPLHCFGLNNVITDPQHRQQGYSSQLNKVAQEFMHETDPSGCGFLFCADDLLSFYKDRGWKKFEGAVTVSQPSGDKSWPSNAMFYDLIGDRSWQSIHLCGLPW